MPEPSRRIAHLDMDAFYASVELLRHPELRGQPVVIGGRRDFGPQTLPDGSRHYRRLHEYVGRGVVTTSTYEARALGVFSAMGMMKAARLAPEAVLLPPDFDAYRHYSRLFKHAVSRIAPHIENRGIDEIYIDLSHLQGDSATLASQLKRAVFDATGLSCSIGITPNKLLSKLASEMDKPDGVTLLGHGDVAARIWPLPVRSLNGIGPKSGDKLEALGVRTIGELAHADPAWLKEHFGRTYAEWLHASAHGIDERPVVTWSEPRSFSRESTFEHDLHPRHHRNELNRHFVALCTRLSNDLTAKGYAGRTVGIKLRFADFRTVTRDVTLPTPINSATEIGRAASSCLRRVALDQKLRLLGVRVGALALVHENPQTVLPFESGTDMP